MENIKMNVEIEKDFSSDEEKDELIQTDAVELNALDNKDNDYLLVGIFGNGSGFLKSALYKDLRVKSDSYKIKFLVGHHNDKTRPKKIVAEVHQFSANNINHLVLHTKQNFCNQSFKFVIDYLKNNGISYKRVAIFDSMHHSYTFNLENKETVFSLKNTKQSQSNQLIKPKSLPAPNTIGDFSAYLLTYHEFVDIPCVTYIAVTNHYEVCLDSVRLYEETSVTYPFFKEKLSQDYFTKNQISNQSIQSLFKEFNSFKNLVYS
jgi:hypothetical protein